MISKFDHLIVELVNDKNYIIEKDGKIYSKRKKTYIGNVHRNTKKSTTKKCYKRIVYKGKQLKVHRIVYAKYVGSLDSTLVIHHKDGNGLNNWHWNLEQVTQLYNLKNKG